MSNLGPLPLLAFVISIGALWFPFSIVPEKSAVTSLRKHFLPQSDADLLRIRRRLEAVGTPDGWVVVITISAQTLKLLGESPQARNFSGP